jgi:threonine/homoserine/homoserine lactone efflux protein
VAVSAVVAFWVTSFLLVVTSGAEWAYMINAGLRGRSVLPAAAGLLLGYVGLTAVVAAGVGTLVAGSPVALGALTLAGAGYLIWLGVGALRHPADPAAAGDEAAAASTRPRCSREPGKGAGISGLNVKGLILFISLLPAFATTQAALPVTAQIAVFGLVHIVSCGVVYTAVGMTARRVLAARRSLARAVSRFSGASMVAIGSMLVAHQFAG